MLDAFKADNFTTVTLTDSINKIPFVPGRAGQVVGFQENGIATTKVVLEEREGVLKLIPTSPRGSAPPQAEHNKRKARTLTVPHVALEDTITAEEVQDVREFGSETQTSSLQSEVSMRQEEQAASFDATLEHMRIGAVKGVVMDADGVTPIHDLYAEFGVSALSEIDFSFDTAGVGDIRTKCHQIVREMKPEMPNLVFNHVHSFCGSDFFDDLVAHDETRAAYDRWMEGEWLRMGLVHRSFPYAGVVFEDYEGSVGGTPFVDPDKAHFFPVGVRGLFRTVFAPGDFMESVNTRGLPRYSKAAVDPEFQRWIKLHSQTNPLVYCTRPRVLRQAKRT